MSIRRVIKIVIRYLKMIIKSNGVQKCRINNTKKMRNKMKKRCKREMIKRNSMINMEMRYHLRMLRNF
jgi:hypothetical protein